MRQRTLAWIALFALAAGCGRKADPGEGSPPAAQSQPKTAKPAETGAPLISAPVPAICAELCKRAPAMACGTVGACADGCKLMLVMPACQDEVQAFFTCAAAQPDAHWECDRAGPTPSLKDGYCEAQQSALVGCMEKAS